MRTNKSTEERTKSIYLRCDDICTMLIVDKITWDDGDINYSLAMQDSAFYDSRTFKNRIRNAWKCLFGYIPSYNDVYTDDNSKLLKFADDLKQLVLGE